MELAALRTFVTVARSGSFTRAADLLDLDKSQVSRIVTALEEELSVQLLSRSTRQLNLTEVGRTTLERAQLLLAQADELKSAAAGSDIEPTGVLRLTCGEEFGQLVVSRWIAAALRTYSRLRVDADFTNRVVDIVEEGRDLAIRVGDLPDSSLTALHLGDIAYGFYAAPDYLRLAGTPSGPLDLVSFRTILFSPAGRRQLEVQREGVAIGVDLEPALVVNNNLVATQMAASGVGIALLPVFQAAPDVRRGRLQPILAGWSRPPAPVHVVMPSRRYVPAKVRAFIAIAREQFAAAVAG